RVTLSRLTICFFAIALANCIVQITTQSITFSMSAEGKDIVADIIDGSEIQRGFSVVYNDTMNICDGIPHQSGTTCTTVPKWMPEDRSVSLNPLVNQSGILQGFNVTGLSGNLSSTTLSVGCVQSLTWLESFLRDAKSEDIVHIIFQGWLFTLSLVALFAGSIPHLIVVLASHALNTGWAGFRVYTNSIAKATYQRVIVQGTCGGIDILGGWREDHMRYAVRRLPFGLNSVSSNLMPVYSKETIGSVGPSPAVSRIYKMTLWLNVCLQFATFFTMTSAAIWFDKLRTDIMPSLANNKLYAAAFYLTAVFLLPWFLLGSISVRREHRVMFLGFMCISVFPLVIGGAWFASALFRYEFLDWTFFAAVTTMSDVFLLVTCVLAVVCRVHFGRGLAHFRSYIS
ncbi:hypothetical protein BV22DRAFT_985448, partial [Leucogyrophana mollusca]